MPGMVRLACFALLSVLGLAPPVGAGAPTLEQVAADPLWMGAFPESPYRADDSASVHYSR